MLRLLFPQLPSTHFAIALSHFLSHPPKLNHTPTELPNATLTHHILASTSHPPPPQMATKLAYILPPPRLLITSHFRIKPFLPLSSTSSSSSSASFPRVHSVPLVGRQFSFRRRLFILSPKATTDQPANFCDNSRIVFPTLLLLAGQVQKDEVVDSKILEYCSIDGKGKKSLGELEQEFLQALQSFYYEGKAIMSNEEFDNLKEELMWEGSSVVMLTSDEQKFLEASMAYVAGKPIMSDQEYDSLKRQLKIDGSDIVVEGPRCSLRSKRVYSDLAVDYFKMFLLNVPAAVVALGLFFFLDDLTGFEITYLLEVNIAPLPFHVSNCKAYWSRKTPSADHENSFKLPEPFSFIFTWFAALPLILWLALSITNFIVKDFLILKGPCPNCGTENVSFFGTILSISSGGSTNTVKCSNCGTEMVYDSSSRLITLPEGSNA
ncbi:hypothetical protein RHSIM_Rhsim07G0096500 [Rhododendron simsii]|uniref:PGR5-like protein 1A, chloroplastic n=1 Tax=Rhododendron simsii TaxID=118357 RepID=A0A834GNC7_RHOSS|nr:hypothetical protein RHSIM_Rhsim07G0096500 [Rhododendron simsii]